jgi:hypothetical protein
VLDHRRPGAPRVWVRPAHGMMRSGCHLGLAKRACP